MTKKFIFISLPLIAVILILGPLLFYNHFAPSLAFADCYDFKEIDFAFIEVSSPTGGHASTDLDYCIIEGDDGNSLVKNPHPTQDTLKVKRGDHILGDFNPGLDGPQSLKVFFTKSFKVRGDHLTFGKKYSLNNFDCTGIGFECAHWKGDISTKIKRDKYNFVIYSSSDELQKIYVTKSTIK